MALACQRDSYLKKFTSKAKSCTPSQLKILNNGKKEIVNGFDVILEDTILFPEGGGQPDDRGKINGCEVLRVTRKGADAINFLRDEIPSGTEVEMTVDWSRRFDNMQQHTGQHLVTALADSLFGFKTTSWNHGERVSFIELDTPSVSKDQMKEMENEANEKIREGIAVTVTLYEDKNDPAVSVIRARGLPDDHVGPIRVITMDGIDANLCCGTHLSNLRHLQAIKLLNVEKGKKGKSNLFFVAGNRVLEYLGRSFEVEKTLTGLLNGPLDQHVNLADKAVKGWKAGQKTISTLLKDIAVLEGQKYKSQADRDLVFVLHRKDGDGEFMNVLVNEIGDEKVTCLVTVGDDKGPGLFLLTGREDIIKDIGPK